MDLVCTLCLGKNFGLNFQRKTKKNAVQWHQILQIIKLILCSSIVMNEREKEN